MTKENSHAQVNAPTNNHRNIAGADQHAPASFSPQEFLSSALSPRVELTRGSEPLGQFEVRYRNGVKTLRRVPEAALPLLREDLPPEGYRTSISFPDDPPELIEARFRELLQEALRGQTSKHR